MAEETAEVKEKKALSPKEMKEKRAELTEFYTEEVELLKKKLEYEELVTKIKEQEFARTQMLVATAQMMAPDPEHGQIPPEMPREDFEQPQTHRKLKTNE